MQTPFHSFFYLILLLPLACTSPQKTDEGAAGPSAAPPNIIFIMVDDLGYGDPGCYGQEQLMTPAIDQLAAGGMRFTDCYTGAPVCAPSRSVLMTGQHSGHTKVRGNFSAIEVPGLPKPRRIPLAPEDTTVAEVLKQAGYVTGMFGKWGLGEAATTGEPNAKGFDEWFGFNNQRRAHSHYPDFVFHNRDTFYIEQNLNGENGQHVHELFTRFALNFLADNRDTTFFMYLPWTLPHSDFEATTEFMAIYEEKPWSQQEKTYAAMVAMTDADVAKIIGKLNEYGIAENTLVMFCSDNGAANRYEGVFDSSGKLKGRKRDMYEGGIRTPMIAWMPGTIPAGQVSEHPWYFPDVLPTLAELAGAEAPRQIDGISVLPLLKGEEMPKTNRMMYWEFHEKGFDRAARWKDWKAVKLGTDGPLELYNLAVDESEQHNVAGENPEVAQKMAAFLDSARSPSPYWPALEAIN